MEPFKQWGFTRTKKDNSFLNETNYLVMSGSSIRIKVLKESSGLFSVCIDTWSSENHFFTAKSETDWQLDYVNYSEVNCELAGQN